MLKDAYKEADTRMKGAIQSLDEDLSGIRTGRATPALIERLPVEYYGMPTPLMQLASISVRTPLMLIKPLTHHAEPPSGRSRFRPGVDPNNDGKVIRLNLPQARRSAAGWSRSFTAAEEARVLRNIRRDMIRPASSNRADF
jgi:ribosome recycling factor